MPIFKSLFIGRRDREVRDGDYIRVEGNVKEFCSGDGRVLMTKNWFKFKRLVLPDVLWRKIKNKLPKGADLVNERGEVTGKKYYL